MHSEFFNSSIMHASSFYNQAGTRVLGKCFNDNFEECSREIVAVFSVAFAVAATLGMFLGCLCFTMTRPRPGTPGPPDEDDECDNIYDRFVDHVDNNYEKEFIHNPIVLNDLGKYARLLHPTILEHLRRENFITVYTV